jgi:hypothetical protein
LTRLILPVTLIAAIAWSAFGSARGDEIVFKKEYGGEKIKCEIYKETDDYIYYIDIKKQMQCGCSRDIVEKVTKVEEPLIDVEAFFLKKAKASKDKRAREKAEAIAAELRKKRLAAEAKKKKDKKGKKEDESEGKRIGKCLIKPATEKTGIKILRSKDTGSNEILVDPFPDEDEKPKTKAATRKPPRKKAKKK